MDSRCFSLIEGGGGDKGYVAVFELCQQYVEYSRKGTGGHSEHILFIQLANGHFD